MMPAPGDPQPAQLSPRPAERRALEAAASIGGSSVLCTTLGRAQAAIELARREPLREVTCWFLDQYQWRLAAEQPELPPRLKLLCAADPPEASVDMAVVPLSRQGEAELARDLLQTACQRLHVGGALVAAVDNPRDRWLREVLAPMFDKITDHRHDDAVVYVARKQRELRKWKDYRCEFSFRDRGRLVQAVSRPGVFSHRRLDAGAKQLLNVAEVAPGQRVLDIGCGSGAVGLALAGRAAGVSVHAIDSNARAVECTLAGAALNRLQNLTAEVNATGMFDEPGAYHVAVANPPYYAEFKIAELFVRAARRSLKPGGRLFIVTKQPDWYEQQMPREWDDFGVQAAGTYFVVTAVRG